jgi:hypothetical protein
MILYSPSAVLIALMLAAINISETSVSNYHTTQHNIPVIRETEIRPMCFAIYLFIYSLLNDGFSGSVEMSPIHALT